MAYPEEAWDGALLLSLGAEDENHPPRKRRGSSVVSVYLPARTTLRESPRATGVSAILYKERIPITQPAPTVPPFHACTSLADPRHLCPAQGLSVPYISTQQESSPEEGQTPVYVLYAWEPVRVSGGWRTTARADGTPRAGTPEFGEIQPDRTS